MFLFEQNFLSTGYISPFPSLTAPSRHLELWNHCKWEIPSFPSTQIHTALSRSVQDRAVCR